MNVLRDLADVPERPAGRAVTIGAFDGVHLGHQAVLRLVRDLANVRGLTATMLTFDKHPAEVVRPDSAPCLLTTLEQKLELIAATDTVEECVVLTFDEARSKETAEEFVSEVLAGVLAHPPRGRRRRLPLRLPPPRRRPAAAAHGRRARIRGARARARRLARRAGRARRRAAVLVDARPDVARRRRRRGCGRRRSGGRTRSAARWSTATRAAASSGSRPPTSRCRRRSACRPTGSTRARSPAPTAWSGPAAISLGRRPTFYADAGLRLLEAYVLDFDGDLYDQPARVRFHRHLRRQERFDSVDALIAQMGRDVAETRRLVPG